MWDFGRIFNNKLLEIHFFWAGKGSRTLNGPLVSAISVTPNFTIPGGNGLTKSQIVGITVASALSPVLAVLVLVFMWKMGWLGDRELQKVHVEVHGRRFTLKQIIDGTRNFSPKMEIGRGRFGVVYRAELPDQIEVAVKKISPESTHQDKLKDELQGEIFFNMKSFKHQNLIQLFDGYSRKELHLLMYEHMENGSLHQALFDPNSPIKLDWKARFEICLGLAKALRYLHEVEENGLSKIIHRNIKASNVLLDRSYTTKLTDFGSARLYNEEDPFMTIKAGASRVYIAPSMHWGNPSQIKQMFTVLGLLHLKYLVGVLV